MSKNKNFNISGEHVVDEVVEHIILEKKGALHEHITAIKPKKSTSKFWFHLILYSIILLELWLIYKALHLNII